MGRLHTHALVVGRGEQSFLEQHGVLKPGQSSVLLQGSIAGVDTARFHADEVTRAQVRAQIGIGPRDFTVMYLGRIARDKGVLDLARAFSKLHPESHLVLVGADEEGLRRSIEEAANCAGRLHFVPFNTSPERYVVAADVVCLPSYREGFGMTLIEAGACGVAVVASRLYGTQDAVVEGVTGLFHDPGNVGEIERCLRALAGDAALRERLGAAGRERVLRSFRPEELIAAFLDYYAVALRCA
jgi:glycosyltransferase involved in cell wall biosynthesis